MGTIFSRFWDKNNSTCITWETQEEFIARVTKSWIGQHLVLRLHPNWALVLNTQVTTLRRICDITRVPNKHYFIIETNDKKIFYVDFTLAENGEYRIMKEYVCEYGISIGEYRLPDLPSISTSVLLQKWCMVASIRRRPTNSIYKFAKHPLCDFYNLTREIFNCL